MNDGPKKFYTGYLVEGLELLIRKVAYTKYDATGLVPWSNCCLQFQGSVPYSEDGGSRCLFTQLHVTLGCNSV
jgi:hypothetical protein